MATRCILITGAGSGIGAGIATELAAAGHHLVVTDVNREAADTVAAGIRSAGGSAEGQRKMGGRRFRSGGREGAARSLTMSCLPVLRGK